MAVSIRIYGLQNRPLQNRKNHRPLRDNIKEALTHFKTIDNHAIVPGINKIEHLIAVPLFKFDYAEVISQNFLSSVLMLGETVAGDEKLFHFTGDSGDVRLVISKPDRIGLWFYQLCVPLLNGSSFLLWFRMHHSNSFYGINIPVSDVVKSWANIVQTTGEPNTILTMDSYYLDSAGRSFLRESGVKYIAAITKERFGRLFEILSPKCEKPGDWGGIHNADTKETVVLNWSMDQKVGKKMVMSNAFKKQRRSNLNNIVPVYDVYKITFSACDRFNRGLHDRRWPHKHGGRNTPGDSGAQHDFSLACILQNTFNAFLEIRLRPWGELDFCELACDLADQIFVYAATLPN